VIRHRTAPQLCVERDAMADLTGTAATGDVSCQSASARRITGKPVDFKELLRLEPDSGTTNIRNVGSKHWQRWLGVAHRCVVPFTSFSEFSKAHGGDVWFALDESRPLAFFAGLWTNWTSVRKVKEGETTNDLFGFLTTVPNEVITPIHPKAMPVILTAPAEIETWLTASPAEALKLQRPLPDDTLKIVATGAKEDVPAGMQIV
jgi:putative SOS response-associated peptidase YedK